MEEAKDSVVFDETVVECYRAERPAGEVMVSVFCLVYNHEKYLRKCLDGFVMQKTDFPFEVLINEDASTDSSAEILREYEAKFPDLFRVTYQTENQFKKTNVTGNFLYPFARGKYVAFCEGDDFWTDPYKLQKQVDALENHPNCHMCMHRVACCAEDGEPIERTYPSFPMETGEISGGRFLQMFAKKHFVHLSSYLVDISFWHKYYPPLDPEHCVVPAPFGDASCVMFFACVGDLFYLDETMSCHRMASAEGWTVQFNRASSDVKVKRKKLTIQIAQALDEFSKYRYHDAFAEWIFDRECFIAEVTGDYRRLLRGENKKILKKTRSVRFRARVTLSAVFPHIAPRVFRWYLGRKGRSADKISES